MTGPNGRARCSRMSACGNGARYFPRGGENMDAAVARECAAVRSHAGIFDASTLGKIEVVGPDAALFLERMYVNGFAKLATGRTRYGLLLREDGFIADDGVIGRLASNRFHVTTTHRRRAARSGHDGGLSANRVAGPQSLADLDDGGMGGDCRSGDLSRGDIIAPLVEGIDLAPGALPHMSVREGRICGTRLRLFRVSFTGELGFELNVPAEDALPVWEALWASGEPQGLVAYGTETMHVLRAEKGFIIVGQDTDGTVTPDDVGLGWAVAAKKPDFVGKRSLARAALSDPLRKQLVGILTDNPWTVLEEGAQIVGDAASRTSLGHVTSAYHSAALGRSIGLAMVAGGRGRIGEMLYVPTPKEALPVRLTAPVIL